MEHLPALPRAYLLYYYIRSFASHIYIESRPSRRFILPAKFRLHAAPEGKTPRAEPVCMRVFEGRKVTSTGSRSDQYCSRRRPVVVAIGHHYCFTQRPVLVTFRSSLIEWYIYVVRAHESLEDCEPVRLVMERGELPCLSSMWDYLWFVLYYEARPPQRMDRHLGAIRSNTL